MYCHILFENEFTFKYNQWISKFFDIKKHQFIIIGRSPSLSRKLVYTNCIESKNITEVTVRNALHECCHIFFHSLHILDYFTANTHLLHKSTWLLWGADLYKAIHGIYENPNNPELSLLDEDKKRRLLIANLHSVSATKEDFNLIKKYYSTSAEHIIVNYPPLADIYMLDKALATSQQKESTTFLVGNSATETNLHIPIFNLLSRFRHENIEVLVPLSYGSTDYSKVVIAKGEKIFGKNFKPLMEYLPFEDYAKIMAKSDVAVYNHNRQQGAGTILPLFYLKKSIFQNIDNNLSRHFIEQGFSLFDVDSLKKIEFPRLKHLLMKHQMESNREIAREYLDDEIIRQRWQRLFNNLERHPGAPSLRECSDISCSVKNPKGIFFRHFTINYGLSPYILPQLGEYNIYGRLNDTELYLSIGKEDEQDLGGICFAKRGGSFYYHPVKLAQYGLLHLDGYTKTQNLHHLDMAERYARKLVETAHLINGALFFPYSFDFPLHGNPADTLKADWYSAMAQGQGLSLLSLLYTVTKNAQYLESARHTFRSFDFTKGTHEPWIVERDASGGLWLEEYPGERSCAALNGALYALFGLYDYCSVELTPENDERLQSALTSVKNRVADFRNPGGISHYCTTHKVTNAGYHNIHIMQLIHLWRITGDAYFKKLAGQFLCDHNGFGVSFENLCMTSNIMASSQCSYYEEQTSMIGYPRTATTLNILMVHQDPCIRVLKEVQALRRLGHTVDLLVEKCSNRSFDAVVDNVYYFQDEPSFAKFLKLAGPWDIIHCHNEPNIITAMALHYCRDTPIVYDCHDLSGLREKLDSRGTTIEAYCFEHSDAVIHVSDTMDDISRQMYSVKRSLVLPSYPTIADISYVPQPKLEGHHIVYEGGLLDPGRYPYEYRNYYPIFEYLLNAGINVHVYVAHKNRNSIRTYFELAQRNPLFHLHDSLPYNTLIQEMSRYTWGLAGFSFVEVQDERKKLFLNNALPNKLFDYLMSGVCPIVFNCDTAGRYAETMGTGYHVHSMEAIVDLIKHKEPKKPLQSYDTISMELNINKLVSLYIELIELKKSSHTADAVTKKLEPVHEIARNRLKTLVKQAKDCDSKGNSNGSKLFYRNMTVIEPLHIDANRILGMISLKTGNYSAAVSFFANVMKVNPLDHKTLIALHQAMTSLGQERDVIPLLQQYLTVVGDNPEIRALIPQ